MRDILPTLDRWLADGRRFAVATVIQTWGSSPRPVGAMMGVRDDGVVVGSVSGGCVESAVVEEALQCLQTGTPKRVSFAASDERAIWEVGLSCGGRIDCWIEPEPYQDSLWREAAAHVRENRGCVLITHLQDPRGIDLWVPWFGSGNHYTAEVYAENRSEERDDVFFHVLRPRDRLLIVGASHIALPLIEMAKVLGFETVVVDPRSQLLVVERFPAVPDQVLVGWPEPTLCDLGGSLNDNTYAVVLSHDPKIDDAALAVLLKTSVAYIGALGSKTTQAKRQDELRALGFTDRDLARIHGPIGLNIGARSPEEIALSILAEIVQVRRSKR